MSGKIRIDTFDGDLEALCELMRQAWSEDYRDQMRFDRPVEYLKWQTKGPSCDADLLIGAYDGSRLVGFCARFPRNLLINGQFVKAALGTFLTTHVEYRRRGIATMVVELSVQRLKEKDYEGYYYILQKGHASTPVYENLPTPRSVIVPRLRLYVKFLDADALCRSWDVNWLESYFLQTIQVIPRVRRTSGTIRSYTNEDLQACLDLLNGFQRLLPVARLWTAEELAWRLQAFPSIFTYLLEDQGQVKGLISFYLTEPSGSRWGKAKARMGTVREKTAFIDNVRLDPLDRSQRLALVSHALRQMKAMGCTSAVIPGLSYFERFPFVRSGFLPDLFTPPMRLCWTAVQARVRIPDVKRNFYLDIK